MSTQRLDIDYAWQHPQPAAIKTAGYEGVLRYLSNDPAKDLTVAEAKALHAQGLDIRLVFETTANRAASGGRGGAYDVRSAEAKADALGYPKTAALFYAVDFDADPRVVVPYFQAIRRAHKRPVGGYGSARVVEALLKAGLIDYAWQTVAWSPRGYVSPSAHLYQRIKPTRQIVGTRGGFDENVVIKDVPAWGPKPAPKPKPKPAPQPKPKPKPTPAPAPAPEVQRTLRVVDWNVERGRKGADVLRELQGLADNADVMTLQEVAGYKHLLNLPGFTVAAEADDVAVLVRDGHDVGKVAPVLLTSKGWWTVRGHMTGHKRAACAVVDGIGFASIHTPPTVQTRLQRLRSPLRWRAYSELMSNVPKVVKALGSKVVVCLDSNVAASTDKGMPGWPLHTFKPLGMTRFAPKDPTHGNRVIDYGFAKGVTVSDMRTLGKLGSDHRPVSFTVTF